MLIVELGMGEAAEPEPERLLTNLGNIGELSEELAEVIKDDRRLLIQDMLGY